MFTRIVVGVDCREGGRDALALAALLQSAGGGELVAVHACAPAPLLHEDVLARVQAELARAGATARPLVVTDRSPAHALRTIAERDGPSSSSSGPPTAPAPIASWPATTRPRRCTARPARWPSPRTDSRTHARALRRIGVGLDGSAESRVALTLACRLAHLAARPCPRHHGRARAGAALARRRLEHAWAGSARRRAANRDERLLAGVVAELDDDVTPEVAVGTAWKELAARSADLDLLVVGARAYGPVRRLLLGSTSTKLARHAACPLLMTPRTTRAERDTPSGPVIRARASRTMPDALRSESRRRDEAAADCGPPRPEGY